MMIFAPSNSFLAVKFLVCTTFICVLSSLAFAQQKPKVDHLTVEEDDIVHEAQELDLRIAVYVKIIERRFAALGIAPPTGEVKQENKKEKKESEKWGALPIGSRAEMLGDVKSVLDEAVNFIDNAAEHNNKSALLPKALKTLSGGCNKFIAQLKPIYTAAKTETERAAAYDASQTCQEVIASSSKLAPNETK